MINHLQGESWWSERVACPSLLGLVVGEGHGQVVEEGQDIVASAVKPVDQAPGAGFGFPWGRVGVGGASAANDPTYD
ncbi:hypothetical protein [Streptomyces sp. NPDC059909]|uniref:hypothetical protein n=1 Tax=Streptomyces sp. NPDC059909 TaxID=3346998 RepID=UPI003649FEC1